MDSTHGTGNETIQDGLAADLSKAADGFLDPSVTAAKSSLLLLPRSLLVFKGEAYTSSLHGIDEVHNEVLDGTLCNLDLCSEFLQGLNHGDNSSAAYGYQGMVVPRGEERISLTIRRVPRVIKGLQLGGRPGR